VCLSTLCLNHFGIGKKWFGNWSLKNLKRHFLRGFSDGDGWLRNKHNLRIREFGIFGNKEFLKDFADLILQELQIEVKIFPVGKFFYLRCSNWQKIEKILDWLSEGAIYYLSRKFSYFLDGKLRDSLKLLKGGVLNGT